MAQRLPWSLPGMAPARCQGCFSINSGWCSCWCPEPACSTKPVQERKVLSLASLGPLFLVGSFTRQPSAGEAFPEGILSLHFQSPPPSFPPATLSPPCTFTNTSCSLARLSLLQGSDTWSLESDKLFLNFDSLPNHLSFLNFIFVICTM